jgi:FixJ family two-component response regulator
MDAQGFTSADEFHQALPAFLPDCLVLDVQMPGTNGLRLQEQLAQEGRSIPIVFITAHDDPAARACALERGARDFLRKPINDDVLLSAIGLALRPLKSGPQGEL